MNRKLMETRIIGCMLTVLLLVSCSVPAPTPTALPKPTPMPTLAPEARTAQEILTAMQDALNAAGSYHFAMDGLVSMAMPEALGIDLQIPMRMAGDVQAPDRMRASLTMTVLTNTVETALIVIGGQAWAQNPTTGQWVTSTPSEAPVSPQQFTELSESELAGMELVGEETLNGQQVIHLSGKVDKPLDLGAALGSMQLSLLADYWIARENNLPLKVTMNGDMPITQPISATVGMSMTIGFSAFGEPVTIEPPPTATP